jgi:Carboxypeptidase regulatory-like domain
MRACTAVILAACVAAIPAGAYERIEVSDGGTITGKVTFNGPVASRKIIPTKDQEVCGGIRDEPEIAVGPDKGIADAVVHLQNVDKGKAWPSPEKAPTIDNVKCRFEPYVQAIPAGEVEIVNSDPVLHNTKAFYGRRSAFNLALPNQGQRIKAELPRSGEVRVECDAHGWMQGWVYVVDNPYAEVTPKDGTFTVTDVPPGTYTLVAAHPYAKALEVPVTVRAKETVQLNIELKK